MPAKYLWQVPSTHQDALPAPKNYQVVFTPQKDPDVGDLTFMVVNLYPHGGTTGVHIHPDGDELIFVESGHGVGVEGDTEFELHPDTVVYARKGVKHGMTNTSDQTMRLLCFFAPKMSDERVKSLTENATVKWTGVGK